MWLQLLIFLVDMICVNLVFLFSFVLRYGLEIPRANFEPFKQIFPALTFCYLLAFVSCGVFGKRFKAYWQVFARIFLGMLFGTMIAFVFLYVFRIKWSTFPSSVFLIAFLLGVILMTGINAMIYRLCCRIRKVVVLAGKENTDGDLLQEQNNGRTQYITVDTIYEILQHRDIDEIMLCEHIHDDGQLNLLVYLLLKSKVQVYFEPGIYAELLSGSFKNENSLRYFATFLGQRSEAEEFFMSALDFVLSLVMLVVLLPFMIVIVGLIKLTSKGPVLFKQERIGKDGRIFSLYKFRTMIIDAEKETGPMLATENDPRVTRVGKFLRATRIDELPQLYNILVGHMSLVGPRPEREHFVKLHKALRGLRLAVKPGLTGLAQIRNVYDLHPRHKIKYDYLYIQRRSFMLNLYILFKTIPVILLRKGR